MAALVPGAQPAAARTQVPTPGSDRALRRRLLESARPEVRAVACLEARLVVEVDGEHHGDQLVYDARRDRWLSELGFRVLRFWVVEVDENLEGVIETIVDALSTADVKGPPPTSPRAAGGGRLHAGVS